MAKLPFLEYMFHHVFLPPKLPQRDDSDVIKEHRLIEQCLTALKSFQKLVAEEEHLPWQSCIKMVSKMLDMRENNGELSAEAVDKSLENLMDGGRRKYA
jgi:hypothetical protein